MNFFKKVKYRDVETPLVLINYFRLDENNSISVIFENSDISLIRNFQRLREYFSLWLHGERKYDERDIILKIEESSGRKYLFLEKARWDTVYGDVNEEDYYIANLYYESMIDVTKNFDRMRKINGVGL